MRCPLKRVDRLKHSEDVPAVTTEFLVASPAFACRCESRAICSLISNHDRIDSMADCAVSVGWVLSSMNKLPYAPLYMGIYRVESRERRDFAPHNLLSHIFTYHDFAPYSGLRRGMHSSLDLISNGWKAKRCLNSSDTTAFSRWSVNLTFIPLERSTANATCGCISMICFIGIARKT